MRYINECIIITQHKGESNYSSVNFLLSLAIWDSYGDHKVYIMFVLPWLQEFACNGTVVDHPEYGEVIQLQGDQRQHISTFLKRVGLAREDLIKVRACSAMS